MEKIDRTKAGETLVVIPARMESIRLPGKPMLRAGGWPLVRWTYERAMLTGARCIVAVCDREVGAYCQEHRLRWMPTRPEHPNGTSRAAEVYATLRPEIARNVRTVINWQVDEPLVEPSDVARLMQVRLGTIATLVSPVCPEPADEPSRVKVVYSLGRCHWFSRSPMRGAGSHVGVYSFRPFLLEMASLLEPTALSEAESLEQLTWVENGIKVKPVEIEQPPRSINTPEDWEWFKTKREENRAAAE